MAVAYALGLASADSRQRRLKARFTTQQILRFWHQNRPDMPLMATYRPGRKVDLFTSGCRVVRVSQPTENVEKVARA